MDNREKKNDTIKALESILQIIWIVMANCNPEQSSLKNPLAGPGRPSVVQVISSRNHTTNKMERFA